MTVSVQIGTRCYETALPSWLDADEIAPESRAVLPLLFTRMYAVLDVRRYDVRVYHREVSVNPHFSPDMTLPNNGLLRFNDWRATIHCSCARIATRERILLLTRWPAATRAC